MNSLYGANSIALPWTGENFDYKSVGKFEKKYLSNLQMWDYYDGICNGTIEINKHKFFFSYLEFNDIQPRVYLVFQSYLPNQKNLLDFKQLLGHNVIGYFTEDDI